MKVHVIIYTCHLQEIWNSAEMYAFYSLLVYIFYTVFKREEEEALEGACGASSDVCLAASWPAWGWMSGKDLIWGTCMCYLLTSYGSNNCCLMTIVLTFECIHKCKYFVYVLPSDLCCCAQEPGPVSMATESRRRDGHTSKMGKKTQLSESSESSDSFLQCK